MDQVKGTQTFHKVNFAKHQNLKMATKVTSDLPEKSLNCTILSSKNWKVINVKLIFLKGFCP